MIEFQPFRLDSENQCLWRGADRIALTPKAFFLLQYLVERAGRLVTHQELLASLWPDSFVQPDVLKTHILDIRRAVGDDAKAPTYIETHPRRGYRFIAQVRNGEAGEAAPVARPAASIAVLPFANLGSEKERFPGCG
jgi:DNA-binding winged helix-turn-helix (wHTH) protein